MHTPRISVITVCFNSASVLPAAITSLAAQTDADFEWVVVDGGSRDGTQALMQAAPLPLSAFVSVPDKGIYDAMNKAVGMAGGDIVYFLNSDDRLHDPQVLHDVAAWFAARPDAHFLLGQVVVEKPGLSVLNSQGFVNRYTLPYTDPCHQGLFVRRALFEHVGLFDLRYTTSADYEWFLRVAQRGHALHHVARPFAFFRAGGAHAADPQALAIERRTIRRRYVSEPALLLGTVLARALHRASATLRGGLALGYYRHSGA